MKHLSIKKLLQAARMILAKKFGYIVYVPSYKAMHFCFSYMEVDSWMKQYPLDAEIVVVCNGDAVARRFAL